MDSMESMESMEPMASMESMESMESEVQYIRWWYVTTHGLLRAMVPWDSWTQEPRIGDLDEDIPK